MVHSNQTQQVSVVLLDKKKQLCHEWESALKTCGSSTSHVHVYNGSLYSLAHNLPRLGLTKSNSMSTASSARVSVIVSPGNSLAFLGGGFDLAISHFFSNEGTAYKDFESFVQTKVMSLNNGYLPPGTPSLVDLGDNYRDSSAWKGLQANKVMIIPTMRVPGSVEPRSTSSNQGISIMGYVFDLTWNILNTVSKYNSANSSEQINLIVIPGLGTGHGDLPLPLVAKAMICAITIHSNQNLSLKQKSLLSLLFLDADYKNFSEKALDDILADTNYDPLKNSISSLFQKLNP